MLDYTDAFEFKKRANAKYFYSLKSQADAVFFTEADLAELRSLVYKIHEDLFFSSWLDDWIYEQIYYSFESLIECDSDSDYERISDELEPSAYNSELLDWSYPSYAQAYIQEALDEGGKPETIFSLISLAQVAAKKRVLDYVWEFLKKKKAEVMSDGNQN